MFIGFVVDMWIILLIFIVDIDLICLLKVLLKYFLIKKIDYIKRRFFVVEYLYFNLLSVCIIVREVYCKILCLFIVICFY